jgi:hypothetical protein
MKDLFEDILEMEDVHGVLLVSPEGEVIFEEFNTPPSKSRDSNGSLPEVIRDLEDIREADLVFEKTRVYIRKTDAGFFIAHMGEFASAAMVRLNCDMLLPSLKQVKGGKGLRHLFKKK